MSFGVASTDVTADARPVGLDGQPRGEVLVWYQGHPLGSLAVHAVNGEVSRHVLSAAVKL